MLSIRSFAPVVDLFTMLLHLFELFDAAPDSRKNIALASNDVSTSLERNVQAKDSNLSNELVVTK